MNEILHEIKLLPSVVGSYVHINGLKEIHSDLPKVFLGKAEQIGLSADRLFKAKDTSGIEINNLEIKFDESLVLAKQIDEAASLITICESGANFPLVNMTTSMLISELKVAVDNARKGASSSAANLPPAAPKVAAAPKASPTAKAVNLGEIMHTGPLAKTMNEFQNALTLAIGPIGEMVMTETVEKWAKKGECSDSRLSELCDMLCAEIDDQELETEFKGKIKEFM
ncbi:MAG: hypothetical protein KKB30_14260 [Proteobacteria bacterium]|nr:hypothetical protein [Pseudomonadota bacterium]MBU1717214.1 hypothetical protein [Pseudomonadota bacterium]